MKKRILTILCIAVAQLSFGQYDQYESLLTPYLSRPIESGYFYFNTPNTIQAGALYQIYKVSAPDLNNDMLLINTHVDSLAGLTHYKYQQLYKTIPVEGAGCIEHYDQNGSLQFINAKIADSIQSNGIPAIAACDAIEGLITELRKDPKIIFAWESPEWEQQIRSDSGDSAATWYPTAELIFAIDAIKNMTLIIDGDRYTLAYKVAITTIAPTQETLHYYVDAATGAILKVRSTHVEVTADVYGYGNRDIDTEWRGGFIQKYELRALDNTHNIHTKKYDGSSDTWNGQDDVRSASTNWGSTYLSETSTHFHVTNSWDYFRNTFSRIGMDNGGSEVRVLSQLPEVDAFYYHDPDNQTERIVFGKSTTGYDYGMEPSVVGHEFTHGVTYHTAGLPYEYESGAINESFSDIFGTVIQAQTLDGGSTDWIMANLFPNSLNHSRSLSNPNVRGEHWTGQYDINAKPVLAVGQPDYYGGDYWCDCPYSVDKGGVHINSGVGNRWFHALTVGNNSPAIQGIGMAKAARIAYFALTSVLMGSSQYTDVRQATLQVASILYGECSIEHQSTANAWYLVGVGNPSACTYTLAIPQINQEDLVIYPNPASQVLNVELPYATSDAIQIYDMTGKLVKEITNENTNFQTDISSLDNGVYNIRFTFNGNSVTKRFIVQKQ